MSTPTTQSTTSPRNGNGNGNTGPTTTVHGNRIGGSPRRDEPARDAAMDDVEEQLVDTFLTLKERAAEAWKGSYEVVARFCKERPALALGIALMIGTSVLRQVTRPRA